MLLAEHQGRPDGGRGSHFPQLFLAKSEHLYIKPLFLFSYTKAKDIYIQAISPYTGVDGQQA